MKPWPKRDEWPTSVIVHPSLGTVTLIDEVGFSQAETEAAMERLRAAVEALKDAQEVFDRNTNSQRSPFSKQVYAIQKVLHEIGPLP